MKRNFNSLNNFSIRHKHKLITYACFDKEVQNPDIFQYTFQLEVT